MRNIPFALACLLAGLLGAAEVGQLPGAGKLDHSAWSRLLRQYETPQARVDYRALKTNGARDLQAYLKQLAAPWPKGLTPDERKAALINAYNALAVNWILRNYPLESIWRTSHPFTEVRHMLDGRLVSLDQIETELRSMGDPRIHGAVVCTALSCPPLRREAYLAERLDQQLDDNVRVWLADNSLNRFDPAGRKAELSMIFDWYKGDFQKAGSSLTAFLSRFAPEARAGYLREPGVQIAYLPYRWGLNDASGIGAGYSQASFLADSVKNKLK